MALKRRLKILDCDTKNSTKEDASLKVAFASSDMKTVDQHFGSAESFVIYSIDQERIKMLEVAQFGVLDQDGNEDKLAVKLEALEGCIAIYSQAAGASAVRQIKAMGIQPVKVSAGAYITDLLESLQEEILSGPATWLVRAIDSQRTMDPNKFDEMEAEGWDE